MSLLASLVLGAEDKVAFVPRVASSFGTFGIVVGIVKSFRSTAVLSSSSQLSVNEEEATVAPKAVLTERCFGEPGAEKQLAWPK